MSIDHFRRSSSLNNCRSLNQIYIREPGSPRCFWLIAAKCHDGRREAVYTLCPRVNDGVHCSRLSVSRSAILSYNNSRVSKHNNIKNRLWGSYIALHNYTFIANKGRHTLQYKTLIKCIHYPLREHWNPRSISPSTVKNCSTKENISILTCYSHFVIIYKIFAFSNFLIDLIDFWLHVTSGSN
jgi:hypothetical protein